MWVAGTLVTAEKNGTLIGPQADSDWLHVVPWGISKLLCYIKDRYEDPEIYITESGVDVPHESSMPLEEALGDTFRTMYFKVRRLCTAQRTCSPCSNWGFNSALDRSLAPLTMKILGFCLNSVGAN